MSLASYLNPGRFTEMSPMMAAIVGCVIGEKFTSPYLVSLHVTSDGFVMGERSGDIGANELIGTAADLERNWRDLLNAANMPPALRAEAERLFQANIIRH